MKTIKPLLIMAIFSLSSLFGCNSAKMPTYPSDTLTTRNGSELKLYFYGHASIAFEFGGRMIYVDPVAEYADYDKLPKADLILVTHSHYDHFDRAAVDTLSTRASELLCDRTTAEAFDMECTVMLPGAVAHPREDVTVEAVAAYNVSPEQLQFHPREREDCGYVVTLGGTRIYIAGDTEPTEEMLALKDIDIVFLPVNQPYTMKVAQAAEAVKQLHPAIFYPYHYGGTEIQTDMAALVTALADTGIEVRVRPLE